MTAPYIIAIDPATSTGICAGRVGATPELMTVKLRNRGAEDEDLFGRATSVFSGLVDAREPDMVAIESPIRANWGKTNNQTTAITRGLYAIFTGIARAKGVPVLRADVGTWRKYFLGRGNLPGAEAKRQCMEKCALLGWPAEDHNAAESAGIWLWACSQTAPAHTQRAEPLFARRVPA